MISDRRQAVPSSNAIRSRFSRHTNIPAVVVGGVTRVSAVPCPFMAIDRLDRRARILVTPGRLLAINPASLAREFHLCVTHPPDAAEEATITQGVTPMKLSHAPGR